VIMKLVHMSGNRPCITDQTIMEYLVDAPELCQWIYDHCERDQFFCVWLLPVSDDE